MSLLLWKFAIPLPQGSIRNGVRCNATLGSPVITNVAVCSDR